MLFRSKRISEDGKDEETVILRRGGGEKGETLLPTETYTLSEWMRESTLFNVIRKIKFFKYYIGGKAFTMWKGIVRYQKYKRTREQLAKELMYSKRCFVDGFVEICTHIHDLQNYKTFRIIKQNVINPDKPRFMADQQELRGNFKTEYERILKEQIYKRLSEVIKAVKESEDIKDEDDGDQFKTKQNAMLKSMVKVKEEKRLRAYCLFLARQNKGMLIRFIQLIDWMIVEALIKINQDSVNLIYDEMTKTEKKTEIKTDVDYGKTNMQFTPSFKEFRDMMDDIIDEMVRTMEQAIRIVAFIEEPVFRPSKKANIKKLIDRSEEYQHTKKSIDTKLTSDFELCQKYAEDTFNGLREARDFKISWNLDDFKAKSGESVLEVRSLLDRLDGWKQKTKYLEQKRSHGIFHVDGTKLYGFLTTEI